MAWAAVPPLCRLNPCSPPPATEPLALLPATPAAGIFGFYFYDVSPAPAANHRPAQIPAAPHMPRTSSPALPPPLTSAPPRAPPCPTRRCATATRRSSTP